MGREYTKKDLRYLQRVEAIQKEFSKYDDGTREVTAIHRTHIEPMFFIGIQTLRRMLKIKVVQEIKKLNEKG